MAYRLNQGRTVERDIRRIIGKQLRMAIDVLDSTSEALPNAVSPDARRHIKKIRAALRLIQPALTSRDRHTKKGLNKASRLLAPLADDEAVLATMARIAEQYRHGLSAPTVDAIRQRLAQKHQRMTRKARLQRVLPEAREILVVEAKRMRRLRLSERGFDAIARGLEKTIRDARRAMAVALEHPTTGHYHAWRRRAKSLWLQMRLLEGRCGGKLGRVEQPLEALDGCLGEYHNAALLEKALMDEAPASRQDTARCLRLVRRYQAGLRRDARRLGNAVHREKPTALVRRVRRYWRQAKPDAKRTPQKALGRRRRTPDNATDTAAAVRRLLSGVGDQAGPTAPERTAA